MNGLCLGDFYDLVLFISFFCKPVDIVEGIFLKASCFDGGIRNDQSTLRLNSSKSKFAETLHNFNACRNSAIPVFCLYSQELE